MGAIQPTHRLPIDIVYKHASTNIETGLKGKQYILVY